MAVPPPPSDKPAWRARLRAARRNHVAALAAEGRLAAASLAAAERWAGRIPSGAVVALYRAAGAELDPAPLGTILAASGRSLALPRISADGHTLSFRRWSPDEPLECGAFGIEQPGEQTPVVAPDVIVAPLLGFDRSGGRLGQGAAFYDRALAALPHARRIGYGWSVQEVKRVPRDPWDVPLHAIATELEWIEVQQDRG